ncbi:MAG: NAD(+)/NADH kinase [Spirochaetota bacterium]|nr:NAD(+)/NADH kinase [Spirochaetota bacterium]
MIKTASINIRPNDKESIPFIKKLISLMQTNGIRILLPDYDILNDEDLASYSVDFEEFINLPDIVIVVGGDGTILGTTRLFADTNIPIFGINKGRLGFLTEFMPEEALLYLKKIIKGNYQKEERAMLEAVHLRDDIELNKISFLNDAVLSRNSISRLLKIHLELNNDFLTCYSGDGLIVSTATGSTAYSLSAGGPIIEPSIKGVYIINPICPHTLSIRPMIIPSDMILKTSIESELNNLLLTIDGQEAIQIECGDKILFRGSDKRISLITHPNRKYCNILRQKLGWSTHLCE